MPPRPILTATPVQAGFLTGQRMLSLPLAVTLSRNSLPALKRGTLFAGTRTIAPVLGLRPSRGGLWFRLKLPKPRISIRSPLASALLSASSVALTASAMSFAESSGCCAAIRTIRSARFMAAFYAVTRPTLDEPTQRRPWVGGCDLRTANLGSCADAIAAPRCSPPDGFFARKDPFRPGPSARLGRGQKRQRPQGINHVGAT